MFGRGWLGWKWMAGMEMDCNLKKLANFFQALPVHHREVAKN